VLASVIDSKRLSHKQHKKIVHELVRVSRAAQSITRMRSGGALGLAAACVGTAAWMWQTGGRDILMERAKAKKPKADDGN
jgi:hypothetical protein